MALAMEAVPRVVWFAETEPYRLAEHGNDVVIFFRRV